MPEHMRIYTAATYVDRKRRSKDKNASGLILLSEKGMCGKGFPLNCDSCIVVNSLHQPTVDESDDVV
jgi:hypothetical protein